jgi:DNA-binding NarL/FixJ family response regulator
LVAAEHPIPVDLLGAIATDSDEDIVSLLSRLEIDGLIEWNDDGTVAATDEAVATARLTRAEWARRRGMVGEAARTSSLPIELVAQWLLDGCRVTPEPAVVPWLLSRADHQLRAGDLDRSAVVLLRVVDAIERGQPVDVLDRLRAYLRLGFILHWLGRSDEANEVSTRAMTVARESGAPVALAIAALAWRPDSIAVSDDPAGVTLIDEALAVLGDGEDALRCRLLAARSDALLFTDLDAARAASVEALTLGRAVGDAETFIRAAYSYRIAYWHPSRQDEMLHLGTEMVTRSTRAVDFAEYGPVTRLQVFLELGDWSHFDGELAAMSRRLQQAPRPFEVLWWQVLRAARAQTRGEWAAADELITNSLAAASGPEYGTAFQLLLTQQILNAWHQGDDLLALVGADLLPAGPMRTSWEACLLGWTCERRAVEDVEAALDRLLANGFGSVREDLTIGPVASSLAMAAARVESARHAATLYDALLPFAEQWAGTGGAVVNGPYALHLGRLAVVLGRADEAGELFRAAAGSAEAGGCTPWRARVALARAVTAPAGADRRRYAQQAAELAASVGMATVRDDARTLLGDRSTPNGLTDREVEALRLVAEGATNAEIASRMYLSVKTVERHLLNAYRKAGVRNRAEAAAYALRELGQ